MTIVVFGLLALVALMLAAALAPPLARLLGMPAALLFAALGLAYGIGTMAFGVTPFGGALDSYDQWFFEQLALDSKAMLYLFLPPLLFEMTLAVNVRRLLEDATVVMVMAILAVAAATAMVGAAIWAATPIAAAACLLLGAAVATTDPGAVISTFREIGAPRRLLVILEGESLLNDAAAIAIFGLLLGILNHAEPSFDRVALDFLYSFGAGAAVGFAVATVAGRLYPLLAGSSSAEASVTVAVAYGSFIAAEQAVGGSGVVAVVFAGLVTGSAGFMRMGPGNWQTVRAVWTQIGFWANALIMILAASLAPGLIREAGWAVLPLTALVYLGAVAARSMILFGLLPAMAKIKLSAPLTRSQSYLVVWGGVRGSVTLVLALSIADLEALGDDALLLAAVAAAYTFATIFLNAGTLAWLTRKLGLNQLSAADVALRERILAGALERVRTIVGNLVRARHMEPDALAAVESALGQRREAAEAQATATEVAFGERLRMGLAIVAGQEARLIRRSFEEGAIGPRAASLLRLDAERIADAARVSSREGYAAAARAAVRPAASYRFAVRLRRFLKLDRPLRAAIELHFVRVLESERIVRELTSFVDGTVTPMIGEDAADNLKDLLEWRRRLVNDEIEAIATQYPIYAKAVEQSLVARAALRRERQQYWRLLNDGVIGQELYDDLAGDLDRRERVAERPPRLDLTLTSTDLIERAPLFARLEARQRRRLARAVRTRFTTPGETIREAGARGQEMFFIASGAVLVDRAGGGERLGSGAFFGEAAILQPLKRRPAKATSLGYCRLLVLKRRDFQKLAKRDPEIESVIREAASPSPSASDPEQPSAVRRRRPRRRLRRRRAHLA